MSYPKWATPERQAHLVSLWAKHGNRCLNGHYRCPEESHYIERHVELHLGWVPIKLTHEDSEYIPKGLWVNGSKPVEVTVEVVEYQTPYDLAERACVEGWVADDRAELAALIRKEQAELHQDRRLVWRGRFDTTAWEAYRAEHQLYYLEALIHNPLTHQMVAKVRIACSSVRLWVDIPSKHARRRARRYGKGGCRRG